MKAEQRIIHPGQGRSIIIIYTFRHTVVLHNSGKFFLFAGADSESRTNDLFVFSLGKFFTNSCSDTKKWLKLKPGGFSPNARSGVQSVEHEDCIFFFGGYTRKGGEYFSDIFFYNVLLNEWYLNKLIFRSNIETECKPEPRTDHSLVKYKNKFYVYGGRDEIHIFSDIY